MNLSLTNYKPSNRDTRLVQYFFEYLYSQVICAKVSRGYINTACS